MTRSVRAACIAAVLVLLAAAAPALSASWVGATHYESMSNDGAFSLGTLTVTACTHEALPRAWSCRGDYAVDDPMADAGHDQSDIALVNDYRQHQPGDQVEVATDHAEDAAYLWGGTRQLLVLAFWLGVAGGLAAIGLLLLRWRRCQMAGAVAALLSAVLLAPTVASIW